MTDDYPASLKLFPHTVPLLQSWLSLQDFARLDTACCNHRLRAAVLGYLSTEVHLFHNLPDDLFVGEGYAQWLLKRQLCVSRVPYSSLVQKSTMIALCDFLGSKLKTIVVPNFRVFDVDELSEILPHCHQLEEFLVTNQEHGRLDFAGRLDFDDGEFCKTVNNEAIRTIANNCPKLKVLRLNNCCNINSASIQVVARCCPQLRRLELNKCERVSSAALIQIAQYCNDLRALYISSCTKASDEMIVALTEHCPLLEELDCSDGIEITGQAMRKLCSKCSHLRYLNFRACVGLTEAALHAIAEHCKRLETLDVRECARVSDNLVVELTLNCPRLRDLYIGDCIGITDRALIAVSMNCRRIRSLLVGGCVHLTNSAITAVAQTCDQLETIDIGMNQKLNDTALIALARGCPAIRTFTASRCHNIGDDGIIAIAQRCPRLHFLGVSGCRGVTDRALLEVARNCPHLYWLDIGCSSAITDVSLNSILRSCHSLYSIDISFSPHITPAAFHGTAVADAAAAAAIDVVSSAVINAASVAVAHGFHGIGFNNNDETPILTNVDATLTREEAAAVVNVAATSMGLIPASTQLPHSKKTTQNIETTVATNASQTDIIRSRSTSRALEVPFVPSASVIMSNVGSAQDLSLIAAAPESLPTLVSSNARSVQDLSKLSSASESDAVSIPISGKGLDHAKDQVEHFLVNTLTAPQTVGNPEGSNSMNITQQVFHTGTSTPISQRAVNVRSRSTSRGSVLQAVEGKPLLPNADTPLLLNQPLFNAGTISPPPQREGKVRSRSTSRGVEGRNLLHTYADTGEGKVNFSITPFGAAKESFFSTSGAGSSYNSGICSPLPRVGLLEDVNVDSVENSALNMQNFMNAVSDALNKIYNISSGGQDNSVTDVASGSQSKGSSPASSPIPFRSRSSSRGHDLPPVMQSTFTRTTKGSNISATDEGISLTTGNKLGTIVEGLNLPDTYDTPIIPAEIDLKTNISCHQLDEMVATNPFAVKEFAPELTDDHGIAAVLANGKVCEGYGEDDDGCGVFGAPVFMPELVVNTAIISQASKASLTSDSHASTETKSQENGMPSQLCSLVDLVDAATSAGGQKPSEFNVAFPQNTSLEELADAMSAHEMMQQPIVSEEPMNHVSSQVESSSANNSKISMKKQKLVRSDSFSDVFASSIALKDSGIACDDSGDHDSGWAVGSSFTPTVRSRSNSKNSAVTAQLEIEDALLFKRSKDGDAQDERDERGQIEHDTLGGDIELAAPPRTCSRMENLSTFNQVDHNNLSNDASSGTSLCAAKESSNDSINCSSIDISEVVAGESAENRGSSKPEANTEVVTHSGYIPPVQHNLSLKRIKVSGVATNNNATIMSICQFCPRLEIIDLNGCLHVNDDALGTISSSCRKLQKLKMRCCQKISGDGVIRVLKSTKWPVMLNLRFSSVSDQILKKIDREYKEQAILI